MSQDFFTFGEAKPRFMREFLGEEARKIKKPAPKPPQSIVNRPAWANEHYVYVPSRRRWEHYAFARVTKQPPKPPGSTPKKFEWPEYCHESASGLPWMKFNDKKAIDKWLSATSGKAYKVWICPACQKYHFIPYPHDVSGTTSGKAIRSNQFRIRMGESPEKVYELETTT